MNLGEYISLLYYFCDFCKFELFFNKKLKFYDILLKKYIIYGDVCKFEFFLII